MSAAAVPVESYLRPVRRVDRVIVLRRIAREQYALAASVCIDLQEIAGLVGEHDLVRSALRLGD
jgi:hypothetical protein